MLLPLPLLLLPGSLCTDQLFHPQLSFFNGQREVVVADFSGCDSIESMAVKVLSEAPTEFALAGLSLGGIVALEMFRQAPNRIKKIALLDTIPRAESPEGKVMRRQQIKSITQGGIESLKLLVSQELLPKYGFEAEQLLRLEPAVMKMAQDTGVDEFINQWQALSNRTDRWSTLKSIRCPMLILCGKHDKLCNEKCHRDMAGYVNHSRLEIIEAAGHLSTLDAPEQVNRALDKWLHS